MFICFPTPYLSKGHFHHCVSGEVEAGDSFSVLQHLHWDTFLWLGFLCGGKELKKARIQWFMLCSRMQKISKTAIEKYMKYPERTHTPQRNFEGKCQLFRDAPLRTSFDPPAEWCRQCLLSETATPYRCTIQKRLVTHTKCLKQFYSVKINAWSRSDPTGGIYSHSSKIYYHYSTFPNSHFLQLYVFWHQ